MAQSKTKIAFIIGANFPTEKAYGVTSRETVNQLLKKQIRTRIFCMPGKYMDSDYKNIIELVTFFTQNQISEKLIRIGLRKTARYNFICWRLGIGITVFKNLRNVFNFNPDFIWVRDPMIAYLCLRRNSSVKIILEVHDETGIFFYKKLFKYDSRIHFFPINKANQNFLNSFNQDIKSHIAPMGIRIESLASQKDCISFVDSLKQRNYRKIQIGYVGKIAPSGYSKGVKELIEFAKYSQEKNLDFYVTLIGANSIEFANLIKTRQNLKINEKYLKIERHVSHSTALQLMRSFDILVLPEYSSSQYIGMPLKLLEYISTGKVTIVADTLLYRSLFLGTFHPVFYSPGNLKSLHESIDCSIRMHNLETHLMNGLKYVSTYTWEHRTSEIIFNIQPGAN